MGLPRASFQHLRAASGKLVTDNHKSYLAEALRSLLDGRDPVATLQLLKAMWSSPFVNRAEQKVALNHVGRWLEDRLYGEPGLAVDTIALELGWLKRLTQVAIDDKRENGDQRPSGPRSRDQRPAGPILEFGERIYRIAERRRAAVMVAAAKPKPQAPPAPPPPPDRLPPVFAAQFVDYKDARFAFTVARKRAKDGKFPKDRPLAIRPTDPQLLELGRGLACSIHTTKGIRELFEADQETFYVIGLGNPNGELRPVTEIALQPPAGSGT